MNTFDPGPEWREIDEEAYFREAHTLRLDGKVPRYWVLMAPVPPLPTEPYSVIRVTWDESHSDWIPVLVLGQQYDWAWSAEGLAIDVHDLPKWITGFDVLAEPRAVTAKAVLDGIASEPWAREIDLSKWRAQFGVQS